MRFHIRLLPYLLVVTFAICALAQQPDPDNIPSVARLRAHIEYLASDKLEGRRTGSAGANEAAAYIAKEFSGYGLRRSIGYDTAGMSILEANSPNRYLQKFPYVAGVELGKNNSLILNHVSGNTPGETQGSFKTISPETFRLGQDWLPLGLSSNGEIRDANLAFAGYGITSGELNYDDYATAHAKDNIAVVFAGTPDGDNPHGQFARAGELRFKVAAAAAAGVRALLVITKEEKLADDSQARLSYDNRGEAAIPVVLISRQLAEKLLGLGKLTEYYEVADSRTVAEQEKTWNNLSAFSGPPARMLRSIYANHTINLATEVNRKEVPSANVVGILDGSDPVLKKEVIVIGAHYDHLGHGGEGSLAPREGEIHHGADDNASGTAGMLELARIFAAQLPRPKRTLVFIAFSGEEEGLLGSNYYVNHPILPLANTVAMINMDMIGRMKDNKLIVGGVGTAPEWRSLVEKTNLGFTPYVLGTLGSPSASAVAAVMNAAPPRTDTDKKPQFVLTLNEDGFGPSDHSSFYAKQIPVLFFWTGTHEDYHKPSDTADKINYDGEALIVGMVARIVTDVAASEKRPTYAVAKSESTGRSTGFRVYLGTIPNYADSSDGLLLDGVRDDSPAAKAGIKAGDKIVKLAGRDVHNVYDYTYALGEMKAGQEYEVELMRAGERIKLKLTPAARK
ncbi:MAG TPA: M20/M25/M40 family metallo-hydrolase [Pyrinomonadaceae bacterium]|nr:M20/M25/M40 family metallo-hydrolase [Pyrinomonadaceae bacterium]